MPVHTRRSLPYLLFTYALPLLCLAFWYCYFYRMQTQHTLSQIADWQFAGLLLIESIGLALAIRWNNNYLGSLYIAFLLLTLGWETLLVIGEGASYGIRT